MLKATLFTVICGLLCTQLPTIAAFVGVAVLAIIEVGLLAWCHGHSPLHYGGAFFALYFIGDLSVIVGLLWLDRGSEAPRPGKAAAEAPLGSRLLASLGRRIATPD